MATVNFRINDNIKTNAYKVLDEQGITPTEFFTNLLKYVVETGKLPVKNVLVSDEDNELLALATKRSKDPQSKFREISLSDL